MKTQTFSNRRSAFRVSAMLELTAHDFSSKLCTIITGHQTALKLCFSFNLELCFLPLSPHPRCFSPRCSILPNTSTIVPNSIRTICLTANLLFATSMSFHDPLVRILDISVEGEICGCFLYGWCSAKAFTLPSFFSVFIHMALTLLAQCMQCKADGLCNVHYYSTCL